MSMTPLTILAPNPSPMTLDGTRTYIVGRTNPVIIDPGPAISTHIDQIVRELAGNRPVAIVLTHSHDDHSAAAPELARRTGAPVWMAPGDEGHAIIPTVSRWLADGEVILTDAGRLRILFTPGHSRDHICICREDDAHGHPSGDLFVGDLFMGQGDTTLIAYPEGNVADYLESLDRIERTPVQRMFPAHGPPITRVRETIQRYRRHRLERIEQVKHAKSSHPDADIDLLVDAVYGHGLHPQLRLAAKASLISMLEYLDGVGGKKGPGGE